jgi:hypothetical protein
MKKSSVLENSLPRDYSPISRHRSEDRSESYSLNAQLRNDVKESPHGPARRKGRTMSVRPRQTTISNRLEHGPIPAETGAMLVCASLEGFDCQLAIRAANFEPKLIAPFSE